MEYVDIYTRDRQRTGESVPRKGAFMKEGQYVLYVLAIIENAQGKYLITQRALDKAWGAGWWECTGGGVPAGEDPETAVVREVAEEVGLDVSGQSLVPVYTYENVDLEHGSNYMVDIFHFHLDFAKEDVVLQAEEAIDCALATWDEITAHAQAGKFLHYSRLAQALAAEGVIDPVA